MELESIATSEMTNGVGVTFSLDDGWIINIIVHEDSYGTFGIPEGSSKGSLECELVAQYLHTMIYGRPLATDT